MHPVLALLLGPAALVVGAELVVREGSAIAARFGISPLVVGMTIVSLGTSLPEPTVALGNLLGSSVFNIALILGPTVLVAAGPVPVPDDVLALDLVIMVAAALVCIPVFLTGRRLNRWEGAAFVASYLGYMAWLLSTRL